MTAFASLVWGFFFPFHLLNWFYLDCTVAGHDVDLFALSAGLFGPSPAPWSPPSLAVHQTPGLVNGCFWLLLFAVLFITLLCFAWQSYDKSTGLEPNQVFGPCTAAVPVLREPSGGEN